MKRILQFLTLSLLTLLSCKSDDSIDPKNIFEKASKKDSLSYYFPSVLNDTDEIRNDKYRDFKQKWYSSSLYSFKEPILYIKTDSQTIYRLLWLRSFHKPVCFTMKEFRGRFFLNAKTIDRQPALYPVIEGKGHDKDGNWIIDTIQRADRFALIDFDSTKLLNSGQWNEIESYISKLDFWNSPVADPEEDYSMDGSYWILEARQNGKYHFIDRHNARGSLRKLAEKLNKWSGLNIEDDSFY